MHADPRYAAVNNGRIFPPITREAAHRFALKLLRQFGSPADAAVRADGSNADRAHLKSIYVLWTQGGRTGRRCWAATRASRGHGKGWGRLIHDISHMVHRYRHPGARPHEHGHEAIELEIMRYVEASGWLEPPQKTTPEQRRSSKLLSLQERVARWESKKRRAENALRKLRRQLARLNRTQTQAIAHA